MKTLKEKVLETLALIDLPGGSNVVSNNSVRAFKIVDGVVSFVIEIAYKLFKIKIKTQI